MLHLKLPTDPRWVDMVANNNIEDILVDHAYCEQKAASASMSLIVNYPELDELVDTLTPIVAEEWEHFERVLQQLRKRGMSLGRMRKDDYVNGIIKFVKKGGSRTDQLVDKLLVSALIEARSCERFKLLWKGLDDEDLKAFYYELMVSEAGHYVTFIDLARKYQDRDKVDERWQEILKMEAELMKSLGVRADRMH
ncbi:tRNA-(ms[2]io[6]A)-hydroxylase [Flammeovirga yaeyamensis]|uniref:tRNA-(Ms[2]io[6]A)-hydroxylase n=2 Tax=Flammeovirga yaeyamensis TaxID=367791 RepID=A0AAX1N8P1_9BACT|nr:tRNA-(ms[2]io[6]A)-hydroxylase [Flammeovirga yaeyamensis]QWG03929.1 tRNA-(ms[2]io[6]A)-hydroxylase [Flammeovirga yaeyamensis]